MRICAQPRQRRIVAQLGLPGLCPAHEEALIAGQAVDDLCLAVLRLIALIRAIGRFQPAEIADILTQRQLAVDLIAG